MGRQRGTAHPLSRIFHKTYDSVRIKGLCNILIEFGIPTKLFSLTGMCLDETHSIFHVGKNLSDGFPIKNDIEQVEILSC